LSKLPTSPTLPKSFLHWSGVFSAAALLTATSVHSHALQGWTCSGGSQQASCELRITPVISLQTQLANILEDSDRFKLNGTVNVVSQGVTLPLQESELVVVSGDTPELYGTAVLPLDKMPLLNNAKYETLPRVALGLVQAATVTALVGKEVPLNTAAGEDGRQRNANQPYLVFHADAGVAFSLDFSKDFEALNNFVFTAPGSVSATAIFDPTDPWLYWSFDKAEGIDLNNLKQQEDGSESGVFEEFDEHGELINRYYKDNDGNLIQEDFQSGETLYYQKDEHGNYVAQRGNGETRVLSGEQFDKSRTEDNDRNEDKHQNSDKDESSADIGAFGFSLNGWIAFTAQAPGLPVDFAGFSGQLLLNGSIPMGPGIVLDGDVVTYAGKHGFAQGGNGDLVFELPGLPEFISFDVPLGNASAALKITDEEQITYISGELNPEVQWLDGLLPVMPAPGATVQGTIDTGNQYASATIKGDMSIGADTLGDWIGVDLSALQATSAVMRVDTEGFEITGVTTAQIHPQIQLAGQMTVYAAMTWLHPENIVLRLTGDVNLFGVALEDVTLEISQQGMEVHGAFVTPLTRIALLGVIDNQGPLLTGTGSINLNLGSVTASMQQAHDDLEAAQAEVSRLQMAIVAMRTTVLEERQRDTKRLEDAQQAVAVAKAAVNSLNSKIAQENSKIRSRNSEISSWYRWYKKAKWHQKAGRYARYKAQQAWRKADIARRQVTIAAYKASLLVAKATLSAANETLNAIAGTINNLPVELDPRVAGLITAKETANAALEVAKLPFAKVPFIEGDFTGDLSMTLNYQGLSGKVTANLEGYSLLEGNMAFSPVPQACIEIPTFGQACTKI